MAGDLTGIGTATAKLIDVVARGIGACTEGMLSRWRAQSAAENARTLALGMREAADAAIVDVSYKDAQIEIFASPSPALQRQAENAIEDRARNRLEFLELRRQSNIERVVLLAEEELQGAGEVPAEPPTQEWIDRYFDIVQDVSSENMQTLWSRILAGEIANPSAFSLRSMEVLRNLSTIEAETFNRLCESAMQVQSDVFVPFEDAKWMRERRSIVERDHFMLGEAGLLNQTDLSIRFFQGAQEETGVIVSGEAAVIFSRRPETIEVIIPIWKFTKAGAEIFSLTRSKGDRELLEELGKFAIRFGAGAKLVTVISRSDGLIGWKNAQEIAA